VKDRSAEGEEGHEDQEEPKLDAKCDQVRDQDRDRHRQARKVDLSEQLGVVDEGVGGLDDAIREVGPDDCAGHIKEELRQAVGGQLRHLPEDKRECDRRQQRLDQVPERPEHGLLVDRHEIAPHEQQHQIAVAPQVIQMQIEQMAAGSDDQIPGIVGGGGVWVQSFHNL